MDNLIFTFYIKNKNILSYINLGEQINESTISINIRADELITNTIESVHSAIKQYISETEVINVDISYYSYKSDKEYFLDEFNFSHSQWKVSDAHIEHQYSNNFNNINLDNPNIEYLNITHDFQAISNNHENIVRLSPTDVDSNDTIVIKDYILGKDKLNIDELISNITSTPEYKLNILDTNLQLDIIADNITMFSVVIEDTGIDAQIQDSSSNAQVQEDISYLMNFILSTK